MQYLDSVSSTRYDSAHQPTPVILDAEPGPVALDALALALLALAQAVLARRADNGADEQKAA